MVRHFEPKLFICVNLALYICLTSLYLSCLYLYLIKACFLWWQWLRSFTVNSYVSIFVSFTFISHVSISISSRRVSSDNKHIFSRSTCLEISTFPWRSEQSKWVSISAGQVSVAMVTSHHWFCALTQQRSAALPSASLCSIHSVAHSLCSLPSGSVEIFEYVFMHKMRFMGIISIVIFTRNTPSLLQPWERWDPCTSFSHIW